MDTTIRNLDEDAYRRLKAEAALRGRTIGDLLSEAIRSYLEKPAPGAPRRSLADLVQADYGDGSERLSDDVDSIAYR
jgi:plasmid stability protein